MIMKCPQCGVTADAPAAVVEQGERCYRCDKPLVFEDPNFETLRAESRHHALFSALMGGLLGALALAAFDMASPAFAVPFICAMFGALLGSALAIADLLLPFGFTSVLFGLFPISPTEHGRPMDAWVLGCFAIVGAVWGAHEGLSNPMTVPEAGLEWLIPAIVAGFMAGSMAGYVFAKRSD